VVRALHPSPNVALKFGLWAPVCGGWLRIAGPSSRDASPTHLVEVARAADRFGYDLFYIPEHYLNAVYGPEHDVADAWVVAAAAAAVTERIRIVTAVQPGFKQPGVVAKMGATLAAFRPGAFGLSLVAGWWRLEAESFGDHWLPHRERYARLGEYLDVIRGLWTRDRFDYAGDYFRVSAGVLEGKPKPSPPIFVAGESEPAVDLAARAGDVLFINGGSPEHAADLVRRAKGLARVRYGRTIRVAISAFGLVRPTLAQAEAHIDALPPADTTVISYFRAQIDGAVVAHNRGKQQDEIDANLGLTSGLVGDPATVLQRLRAFERAGVDTVVLKFEPSIAEAEIFAREVIAPYRAAPHVAPAILS
jgi:FMNH2-dependent dimethyl sulfone monooxygenase